MYGVVCGADKSKPFAESVGNDGRPVERGDVVYNDQVCVLILDVLQEVFVP